MQYVTVPKIIIVHNITLFRWSDLFQFLALANYVQYNKSVNLVHYYF
jgi:hypothetical protein